MPEIPEQFRAPIVYATPGMAEARVERNIVYRVAGETPLHMDVYRPGGLRPDERRPAIIFVHGDAPPELLAFAKDWGCFVSWGRLIAASGMIGVTFNHRSTLKFAHAEAAIGDVVAAIAYVREHADSLGVDPERLCFWVASAGGFTLKPVLETNPPYIRCIVAYYAVLDLPAWLKGFAPDVSFDGLAGYTAATHITGSAAPMLLARAGLDDPGLNSGIDGFIAAAFAAGAQLDVLNHATGRHAFDIVDDNHRSREIIATTLEFMKCHLGRQACQQADAQP